MIVFHLGVKTSSRRMVRRFFRVVETIKQIDHNGEGRKPVIPRGRSTQRTCVFIPGLVVWNIFYFSISSSQLTKSYFSHTHTYIYIYSVAILAQERCGHGSPCKCLCARCLPAQLASGNQRKPAETAPSRLANRNSCTEPWRPMRPEEHMQLFSTRLGRHNPNYFESVGHLANSGQQGHVSACLWNNPTTICRNG